MSVHWWSLVPLVFLDRLIGDDRLLHAQVAIKTRVSSDAGCRAAWQHRAATLWVNWPRVRTDTACGTVFDESAIYD